MAAERFQYLFNYITIAIMGDSRERFINLCRNRGIPLMNLNLTDNCVTCVIKRAQFAKLRPICKTTGCRVKITGRQGTRYLAFKYRKHYSFVIGIFIAFALIKWLNLFVWDITLNGNGIYSDHYIESYLSGLGIKTGMQIENVDCEWIETKIREDFELITWASVSKNGTRLVVSVKENDNAAIYDKSVAHDNIYASEDGVLETIIVRSGTPLVHKGDTVARGQLLVSGQLIIEDAYGVQMDLLEVGADADIYINTTIKYIDTINRTYTAKTYTGKICSSIVLESYGKEITFLQRNLDDGWDISNDSVDVRLFGLIALPVSVNIIKYNEFITEEREYTNDEMRNILSERFDSYIKNLQNSVQILDNNVKITEDGECFKMEGDINVIAQCVQYEADVSE